jgi:hypothetical protein
MRTDIFWPVFVAAAFADIVVRVVWQLGGY